MKKISVAGENMSLSKLAADLRGYVEQSSWDREMYKIAQTNPALFSTFKHFITQAPTTTQTLMRQNPNMLQNYFKMFQTTGSLPWLAGTQRMGAGVTGQTGRQMLQNLPGSPNLQNMAGFGGSARGNQIAEIARLQRVQQNASNAGVSPNAFSNLQQFKTV